MMMILMMRVESIWLVMVKVDKLLLMVNMERMRLVIVVAEKTKFANSQLIVKKVIV